MVGGRKLYIGYAQSDSVNAIFIALGMLLEVVGEGTGIENRGCERYIRRI